MPTKKKTDTLDFDPVLCLEQYDRLQSIGRAVCYELNEKLSSRSYDFHRVATDSGLRKQVRIVHGCTWLEVPTKIFVQGVDAIVDYVTAEYKAELAKRKKQIEKDEKDRLKRERAHDMREYLRLKEKLGFGEGSEEEDT